MQANTNINWYVLYTSKYKKSCLDYNSEDSFDMRRTVLCVSCLLCEFVRQTCCSLRGTKVRYLRRSHM